MARGQSTLHCPNCYSDPKVEGQRSEGQNGWHETGPKAWHLYLEDIHHLLPLMEGILTTDSLFGSHYSSF